MNDIMIKSPACTFQFSISSHFNVILGDSSTQKTFLCTLAESRSPLVKKSHTNFCVIDDKTWYRIQIENKQDMIYFVDESFSLLHQKEFSSFVLNNNSYFIVISREPFHQIPYGINDIFKIKKQSKRLRTLEPAYNLEKYYLNIDFKQCFIEDESTGLSFFKDLLLVDVQTTFGKEKMLDAIKKIEEETLFIFDYCGFGPVIKDFIFYLKYYNKSIQILPYQSFEEYILSAFVGNIILKDNIINKEKWYENTLYEYSKITTMDHYKKDQKYRCFEKCTKFPCRKYENSECLSRNSSRDIHTSSKYKDYIDDSKIN